ncbi:SAM-dependent DNA methyltransferase, partial [bacterium]|nr:SAM-dependent DNA methyltransferase [bacterium]
MEKSPLAEARSLVSAHEDLLRENPGERRRAGRYYTPELIVRFLVARILGPLVARADRACGSRTRARAAILELRVVDPCCGAGAFLLGTLDYLARALVERGERVDRARAQVARSCLLGIDTDAPAIVRAREALALASGGALAAGVRVGDALAEAGLAATLGVERIDAVLGNPPYLREKDGRDELARARATALGQRYGTGKMDLWFLFAHAALEALGEGGRHGFVVPAYWLEAAGARRLREHLRAAARL